MEEARIISGNTPDEIWQQIDRDFAGKQELFDYSAIMESHGRSVTLDIDIDLGGGFEGGYALTRFVSSLKSFDDLRFSMHRKHIMDGIGKFFGMKDVLLGYPEFDGTIVVKTNHADRLRDIFSDSVVRQTIKSLPEFNFHTGHHHSPNTQVESAFLELRIDEGITDTQRLREIYHAFISVLDKVDLDSASIMKFL